MEQAWKLQAPLERKKTWMELTIPPNLFSLHLGRILGVLFKTISVHLGRCVSMLPFSPFRMFQSFMQHSVFNRITAGSLPFLLEV
jgi:hypothetical protein